MNQKNLQSAPEKHETRLPSDVPHERLMRLFSPPAGETYISLSWTTFVLAIAETATPKQIGAIAGMRPVKRDDLLQAVVEEVSEQIASNIDTWVETRLRQSVVA